MPRIFTLPQYTSLRRKLRRRPTRAERFLWDHLQARRFQGLKFRRQHGIGRFVADFFCAELMLVIEVDGDTHLNPDQIEYDRERQLWIEAQGIQVVRFTDAEVLEDIDNVLQKLQMFVPSKSAPSSPRRA